MTKTYLQVLKQIDELKAQAEKLRSGEIEGVVKRIRDAITHYGLTAADLGLSGGTYAKAAHAKPGRKPGRPKKRFSALAGKKVAPKFRDESGNTWAGRGKRPVWLRTALAAGRKLEDFAVNGPSGGASPKAARKKRGRKPGRPKALFSAMAGKKVAPKFRDENGNTWAGRGQRPVWLRTALAAGRRLEDFAVKK